MSIIIPPYLKKGDTIAVVCPAGYMAAEKAQTAIAVLQDWGYRVITGKTLGHQHHYFSGTDAERLNDFQEMLDNPDVKAILCGRGGYGVSRIIDGINWKAFKKNPKWIIGFSDITVLHAHLFTRLKTASLHAPMAAAFNDGEYKNEFIQSLRAAMSGKRARYSVPVHALNRVGEASGLLVGGNVTLLSHIIGTASDIDTKGKILFIEDIGEYIYKTDRMMVQMERSGKLSQLAGLVVGCFTDMTDTTIPFGQTVEAAIWDKVKDYDYPVCFNFPVSHNKENYALKVGVEYTLKVKKNSVVLAE